MHRSYCIYILARQSRTLYVGITNDPVRRISEHRNGDVPGFSRRYSINKLFCYEESGDVHAALQHEKKLKGWRRAKKLGLIDSVNPSWRDLSLDLIEG